MSVLTIAQDVAASIGGIDVPRVVMGSAANAQLGMLIQKSAEELASRHDWSQLVRTHTFTPVNAAEQPNSVPDDFDRFAGEPTMWLGTEMVGGPVGAGFWAQAQANAPVTPYPSFRMFRGSIWFTPVGPHAGSVSYEYQTKNFVIHEDGTTGDRFTSDKDTTSLPERLIRLFTIAWWKQAKGFDYAEDMSTAERELEREAGRDGGMADIVTTRRFWSEPLGPRHANGPINGGAIGILSSGGYVNGG